MRFRLSDIEKMQVQLLARLESGPPPDPRRRLSTVELVRRLAPAITTTREKGYTLDQVAAFLAESGIAIRPSTLKRYLRLAKRGRRRGRRRSISRITIEHPTGNPAASSTALQQLVDETAVEPLAVQEPAALGLWSRLVRGLLRTLRRAIGAPSRVRQEAVGVFATGAREEPPSGRGVDGGEAASATSRGRWPVARD